MASVFDLDYQCLLCNRTTFPVRITGSYCDECTAALENNLSSHNEDLLDDTLTYNDDVISISSTELNDLEDMLADRNTYQNQIHGSLDLFRNVWNVDNARVDTYVANPRDTYPYRELMATNTYWNNDNARADTYFANPRDYANTAEYARVLQSSMDVDVGSHGSPASKAAVESLECVVIGEKDGKQALDCSICLELVNVGEVAKMLPCGHGFHGECITTWLFSSNSCPLCRSKLCGIES